MQKIRKLTGNDDDTQFLINSNSALGQEHGMTTNLHYIISAKF